MNIDETTELLEYIQESYPGRFPVNVATIKVWHDMLADQDFEGVMYRVRRYIAKEKFPPAIADLKIKRYPVIG